MLAYKETVGNGAQKTDQKAEVAESTKKTCKGYQKTGRAIREFRE